MFVVELQRPLCHLLRLMPLASLCVHVKIGSQVSSIPADYSGSRGNDNSQSIGNRVKSHFASGSKLTIVQFVWVNIMELNHVEMWLCCAAIRLACTGKKTKELSSFLVAAFTLGERTTGFFGLLDSRLWSFPPDISTGWPHVSMLGQKRDCPLTLKAFLVEWLMHFKWILLGWMQ